MHTATAPLLSLTHIHLATYTNTPTAAASPQSRKGASGTFDEALWSTYVDDMCSPDVVIPIVVIIRPSGTPMPMSMFKGMLRSGKMSTS